MYKPFANYGALVGSGFIPCLPGQAFKQPDGRCIGLKYWLPLLVTFVMDSRMSLGSDLPQMQMDNFSIMQRLVLCLVMQSTCLPPCNQYPAGPNGGGDCSEAESSVLGACLPVKGRGSVWLPHVE